MYTTLFQVFLLFTFTNLSYCLNEKYRRSEIIITDFKDPQGSSTQGNSRFAEVYLNGNLMFTRTLKRAPNLNDVEFVYQDAAYEYDRNIRLNGFFEPNITLSNNLFNGSVQLRVVYYYIDGQNTRQPIATFNSESDIRCAANSDWLRTYTSSRMEFDYYISYWCKGYTGKGCQYECDESADSKYDCFYEDGKRLCKDSKFNNPPDCNRVISTCIKNPCKNNGTCVHLNEYSEYCQCMPGWTGQHCERFVCEPPCDPDFGKCDSSNHCKCSPGRGGKQCEKNECTPNFCKNGGSCFVISNDVACNCDASKYAGKKCQLECRSPCQFGTCVDFNGEALCQCDDDFEGITCNETKPLPSPIFQDGYISPKIQKIAYLASSVSLVVFAIVCVGLANYFRHRRMTKLKIIKGTESAVQAVQIAQSQTMLRNTMITRSGLQGQ